jgi:hypothetical protein
MLKENRPPHGAAFVLCGACGPPGKAGSSRIRSQDVVTGRGALRQESCARILIITLSRAPTPGLFFNQKSPAEAGLRFSTTLSQLRSAAAVPVAGGRRLRYEESLVRAVPAGVGRAGGVAARGRLVGRLAALVAALSHSASVTAGIVIDVGSARAIDARTCICACGRRSGLSRPNASRTAADAAGRVAAAAIAINDGGTAAGRRITVIVTLVQKHVAISRPPLMDDRRPVMRLVIDRE